MILSHRKEKDTIDTKRCPQRPFRWVAADCFSRAFPLIPSKGQLRVLIEKKCSIFAFLHFAKRKENTPHPLLLI